MIFILFIILLFGAVLVFGWYLLNWQYSKADRMLEKWADQNSLKVIEKESANFGDGPIGRRGSATFVKYRIKTVDSGGRERNGVITLGNENTGVLSDEIRISWDN